ncbi:MAG: DNA helicase RecQ [Candidatus Latescibacteria bacterium]|nr:DNA helicase RecQ [Candidatus Latescibacterota bacterium]
MPLKILQTVFGYDQFRLQQEAIIQRLLAGQNAAVIMPTGGGKSICYQIPALMRKGTGIVVSPLISLMQDQVDALKQLDICAEYLNSNLDGGQQYRVIEALLSGSLDLLYVAPERLMMPDFLNLLTRVDLSLLAIDEAHCISQWGHDFRPEYRKLAEVRNQFPNVPCIAATATADDPTRREIVQQLHIEDEGLFVAGFDRPNIRYAVVQKNNAKQQLLRFIETQHSKDAGIVYCLSRRKVEDVAQWLVEQGHNALPYHAGLAAEVRLENQDRFLKEEGLIVVATIAFGMGIDKPNVRFVAHMDIPKSPESYYQETGRAGRDGLPANAWMTYGLADVVLMQKILSDSEADEEHKRVEWHKFNALVGYCESAQCRRQVLLSYFGDTMDEPCGNCDTCLTPVETFDGTVAAQKFLSCVHRTGQRFGAGHVVDVLLGKMTNKIESFGHQALSTFGIGEEHSVGQWRSIARQLVTANYLSVDIEGYGGLRLTPDCGAVLKGEKQVLFRKDPKPERRSRKKEKTSPAKNDLLDDQTQPLFDALRDLRLELAREQGIPPYIIFHDSTLIALAQNRPKTVDDLGYIPGVGAVKLERYGEAFLNVICTFENRN